ncbi:MAG: 50S ribosomal protein L30 [Clostridiales bacterium]|jgi:large subunit ribosomal protein L30|nr:50S ribosomal protein L30 [Clostridiales bacterium]
MAGELKVTLVRSTIGVIPKQKKTIEALGLGKINSVKVHKDNGAVRGMLHKVSHLVKVEEI